MSFVLWLWLLVVLGPMFALAYVVAIVLHEAGHFFVAKRLGYQLSKFSISPYGVSLSYFGQNFDFKDEIKIALAGPAVNLLSVLFVMGLWWICPNAYFFTDGFVEISLVLALFNLLPAFPLDGGRVFVALSSCFCSEKVAKKITIAVNIILSAMFFVLFVALLFVNFNPTYLLMAVFLIGGVLDLNFSTKFEKINIFSKKVKNFSRPFILCITPSTTIGELVKKMQSTKTFIFSLTTKTGKIINISEATILRLCLTYPFTTKLEDLMG